MARTRVLTLASVLLVACLALAAALLLRPAAETPVAPDIRMGVPVRDGRFPEQIAALAGVPLSRGDQYDLLVDGDETFARMLGAIGGARHRIGLEIDGFEPGETADAVSLALAGAARRGVEVRVVAGMTRSEPASGYVERLRAAGVRLVRRRVKPWRSSGAGATEGGRRLLVVDGEVGFIGSAGIADRWRGHAHDADHWRGLEIRVAGPTAARLEGAFLESWLETGGDDLPVPDIAGDWSDTVTRSLVVRSAPGAGSEIVRLVNRLSIAGAEARITIVSPSLSIDAAVRDSLVGALRRGVRVVALMDDFMDDRVPDDGSVGGPGDATMTALLAAGLELYLFRPTRMLARATVVDGTWTLLGSTGLDLERLLGRPGLLLAVHDVDLAARIERQVELDLARSTRLSLDAWTRRRPGGATLDWLRHWR